MITTPEHVERLKQHYLETDLTLEEVAKQSMAVCGMRVTHDAVKKMAQMGKWGVLKRRAQFGREGLPKNVEEEAQDLRELLYSIAMDPDQDMDLTKLTQLIGSWDKVKSSSPSGNVSAKTGRQQQIEATRRAAKRAAVFAKSREGKNDD